MKASKYIDILGQQFPKRTVLLVVGTVTMVVGGVVGLLYYLLLASSAPIVAAPTAPTAPTAPSAMVAKPEVSYRLDQPNSKLQSQSSLVTLLEKYLQVTQLSEVNSLIVHGTGSSSIGTCELTVMARRPNLYTLKVEALAFNYFTKLGYDGKIGWSRLDFVDLNKDEIEFFMRVALFESSLAQLAWSYQSLGVAESALEPMLERLPDAQWQGRHCAVIVSRGLLPIPIHHYIDQQSYEEVYRRTQVLRGTDSVNLEIHFAPSEAAASPRLPMGYELYFDGRLHDTITFNKIRPNRALFESQFKVPSDANVIDLSPRTVRAD